MTKSDFALRRSCARHQNSRAQLMFQKLQSGFRADARGVSQLSFASPTAEMARGIHAVAAESGLASR